MAEADQKYIADWIRSNEAMAQIAHFHASRLERLYAYDGDGLAETQLAVGPFITRGLLLLPDGTEKHVDTRYLLHDPARLAAGYDRERHATIFLLRREVDRLTRTPDEISDPVPGMPASSNTTEPAPESDSAGLVPKEFHTAATNASDPKQPPAKTAKTKKTASDGTEPKTKTDRAIALMPDLDNKGEFKPGMRPAEIEQILTQPYKDAWGKRDVPSRDQFRRAYQKYRKTHPLPY
jgi:hypothetical protein